MQVTIRSATVQDAPQITKIIKAAFEEEASVIQVQTCIEQEAFRTYVAESDDGVIGFVFGFITTGIDGTKRRELDLLAVHPDVQGKSAGTKLIEYFTNDKVEADCIRSLIRNGNIRMEKALTRIGYATDDIVCGLYVSSNAAGEATAPQGSHLIPVTTMTYKGIWLEGDITTEAIQAAMNLKKSENDIVGAVVPMTDEAAIAALQAENFTFIDHYRTWVRTTN